MVSTRPVRELVEERLERVVVVPVDEHDVGVGVLQLLHGADAGEAAAEDHDARALWAGRGVGHGAETLPSVAAPPSCDAAGCRPSRRARKT